MFPSELCHKYEATYIPPPQKKTHFRAIKNKIKT